jgi:GNAT superfamily N-acetyltransferase
VYVADTFKTRPWRSDDLDVLRASESLFAPQTYPHRVLARKHRLRPLHLRVVDQLDVPGRRWTGQVVVDGDRMIALAECSWDPADPASPTVTVNVAAAWQADGIGRSTLRDLVSRCLSMGLKTFNVDFVASNVTPDSMLHTISVETGAKYTLSGVTRAGLGHLTVQVASYAIAKCPG